MTAAPGEKVEGDQEEEAEEEEEEAKEIRKLLAASGLLISPSKLKGGRE